MRNELTLNILGPLAFVLLAAALPAAHADSGRPLTTVRVETR